MRDKETNFSSCISDALFIPRPGRRETIQSPGAACMSFYRTICIFSWFCMSHVILSIERHAFSVGFRIYFQLKMHIVLYDDMQVSFENAFVLYKVMATCIFRWFCMSVTCIFSWFGTSCYLLYDMHFPLVLHVVLSAGFASRSRVFSWFRTLFYRTTCIFS